MKEKVKYSLWGVGFLAASAAILIPISIAIVESKKPSPIDVKFAYSTTDKTQKTQKLILNSYSVVKDGKEQEKLDINYILTINDIKKMIEIQTNKQADFYFYENSLNSKELNFNEFWTKYNLIIWNNNQ